MEPRELRDLSDEELGVKERDLRESVFLLRLRHGTNQLESPMRLKQARRDLARLKTIQRERELGRK
jgi:large subunit ribosomal protein L29